MSLNTVHVAASVDEVFAVLVDPYSYPRWLAGAKHIRAVDDGWPEPGTCFHHQVGIGPFRVNDSTKMLEIDGPVHLLLEVRVRPFGRGTSDFRLKVDGDGCTVTLEEHLLPPLQLAEPLLGPLLHLRNSGSLKRLKQLLEERSPAQSQ